MATAGKILMFPVGDWTSGNNYGFLDITYFGGSSYIAKTDISNSTINPATDTTNWQILAHGYLADTLSGINGIDTSGLLGTTGATVTGQALIDIIADKISTKLLPYTHLVNNGTTTVSGQYALDGAYGKTLADGLATANSNLALKADKSSLGTKITLSDTGVFHISRQTVIEYPNYYAVAITITPTATPTSDIPMLTFPKQLATCVLFITTGFANGITYASNNNQMFYRLHVGTIDNTTEIIINGIIPRA